MGKIFLQKQKIHFVMEVLKLITEVETSPISNLHFHSTLVATLAEEGRSQQQC